MYKWDKTGIDNIEGYATYIERSAKLMNLMKTVGFVGIGLDFSGYTSNVYDACSKGRESACKKRLLLNIVNLDSNRLVVCLLVWRSDVAQMWFVRGY